ncbi:Ig-like domain-containing protein [Marinagarivorans algicola]|uniref:Ig-like domain-containing protein n=1 Tax=Marinagarivorans algicola TaxID=1513270 RepID=UPI0006B5A37F|nr:Ig-like domain-containing protein [Marinagarivorans algicola]
MILKHIPHLCQLALIMAGLSACSGSPSDDSSSTGIHSSARSSSQTAVSSVAASSSPASVSPVSISSITGVAPGAVLAPDTSLVVAVTTTNDANVRHIELFLNNTLVRKEGIAPYDWNNTSIKQSDALLQSLVPGAYTLRAVLTSKSGTKTTKQVRFSVAQASTEPTPDLATRAQKIFDAGCASSSCHDATPGGARVDLVTGTLDDFAKRLVGQPSGGSKCSDELIIDPVNPANSLFLKITDAGAGDQCMAKMPFGKAGVTPAEHAVLIEWVNELVNIAPPIINTPDKVLRIEPVTLNKTQGYSVAHYAKKILTGSPLTNGEYKRITDNGDFNVAEYEALLKQWIKTDKFDYKIRQFLRLALQQNASPLTNTDYWEQLGGLGYAPKAPVSTSRTQKALHEMMVQTALRIINGNQDFRTIVTTRDWEVSTIVLAALGRADQQHLSENSEQHRLRNMPGVIDSDYDDWRTITLKQGTSPGQYEKTEDYIESMRALKDGDSYELLAPRVGFFTTPAFIFNWETNPSNEFRLTLNQTLISALGLSFEAGDTTKRNHSEGIIADHAVPGTDCHACHTQMDPMRNVFLQYYHSENTRALKRRGTQRPDFSLHGLTREVKDMDEFAQALADHPNFAFAWASKMCQWVTSVDCDKKYPDDVKDIAEKFKASGFKFKTLLLETFKSPLVINGITDNTEMLVSIARQDHFCTHLDSGLNDIAKKRGRTNDKVFCDKSVHYRTAQTDLIPNDEYTRGKISLLQPSQIDPFYVKSVEYLCSDRDYWFIGNKNNVPFHRDKTEQMLDDMTQVVLGIPSAHEHYGVARQSLARTYAVLRKSPKCANPNKVNIKNNATPSCGYGLDAQKAVETLWKMTCSAPSTISVGLGF